jgi:predicted transglutaminase-like cysteine proteinase
MRGVAASAASGRADGHILLPRRHSRAGLKSAVDGSKKERLPVIAPVPSFAPSSSVPLVRLVLALLLACAGTLPRAWDADRMLAAAQRLGSAAVAQVRALQPVLAAGAADEDEQRLQEVNRFFNRRIVFVDDIEAWGQNDYWASPLETLEKGRGDCEDFAIAKYFSLIASGVPAAKMRLVYVRATIGGPGGVVQPHMVLAYYAQPAAEPLILDNLIGDVRPASRRPDLQPVFSFNGEGLWEGAGARPVGDPLARLSRWRDVLAKARAEGFQ